MIPEAGSTFSSHRHDDTSIMSVDLGSKKIDPQCGKLPLKLKDCLSYEGLSKVPTRKSDSAERH